MDYANIIAKQLERAGNDVVITDGEWSSVPFSAVVSHLWRKKSSAFEPFPTEIGVDSPEYYLYIGPAAHNIMNLSAGARLTLGDTCFEFRRRDEVKCGNATVYYTGILRRLTQTEYEH